MMAKVLLPLMLLLAAVSSTFGKAPDKKYIPKTGKRVPQNDVYLTGWGDQLIWAQTYEEALHWSRSKNRPLMVIHHLDDCPHSQALKKEFAENYEIQKILDEDFVVLNLVHETTDKHLYPDKQYVPRILFVDPSMTVRAELVGPYSNRMYTYEPGDIKVLMSNMQLAKKLLKSEL
ncbi:anterior gradient protein 2 homolog [Cynoglossus semilaevis]|uniref:Anterior gradient 2 n=1 Tax=Cynoglossus semilaevis TaxID=244447 RepID=A0A3P8WNZ9_CYNSE|nr:anterior gradient protein 2 homolog [Cynoglossus semilaevis]